MPDIRSQYLSAAATGLDLLKEEAVAAAWAKPSALTEFTVGGLAAHLATQVLAAAEALDTDFTARPRKSLFAHFFEAAWIDGDLHNSANAKIRDGGEHLAQAGPAAVVDSTAQALAALREGLPALPADAPGGNPAWAYATGFDDFLITRIMEIVVHADDLAHSVGIDTPAFEPGPFDTATWVLTRLAAHRHGQTALIRALARTERAPGTISGL